MQNMLYFINIVVFYCKKVFVFSQKPLTPKKQHPLTGLGGQLPQACLIQIERSHLLVAFVLLEHVL